MGYNVYMTRAGYALQAKLFAEGGDPVITRVEVGSGTLTEDIDPGMLTELLERRCTATSTKPVRKDCAVDLTVEYRSDLDGGLKEPFQIREFGVFATGAEGEAALILYGDLSDYPESAVPQEYGGCVRRFPVHLEIGPNANVSLAYPAGAWVTHEELGEAIAAHDGDENAHPYIRSLCSGLDARLSLVELMYDTNVSGNPFTVTFETLDGLEVSGVWNQPQARVEF